MPSRERRLWRSRPQPYMRIMAFFSRSRREREEAERIYHAVVGAARHPAFYTIHGVPDTFVGRFEMLVLHLFPLVHRLTHGAGGDAGAARAVMESLVMDLDGSMRELGVGDLSVGKRVKALFGSYGGRLAAYAQAAGESEEALALAIRRNVFAEGGVAESAPALASWLRRTLENFERSEAASLKQGMLPYADPAGGAKEEVRA